MKCVHNQDLYGPHRHPYRSGQHLGRSGLVRQTSLWLQTGADWSWSTGDAVCCLCHMLMMMDISTDPYRADGAGRAMDACGSSDIRPDLFSSLHFSYFSFHTEQLTVQYNSDLPCHPNQIYFIPIGLIVRSVASLAPPPIPGKTKNQFMFLRSVPSLV